MNNDYILDFEKPLFQLEQQIRELEQSSPLQVDLATEIQSLRLKSKELLKTIYSNLTPWQRVQLARHPLRPQASEHIKYWIHDFEEIHGDKRFSDDASLIAGFGFLSGEKKIPVAIAAIDKGRKTAERIKRNFGMPKPEGYRKALRLMTLAERFKLPLVMLVDTPGAYPGIDAEERGQALAIAENLQVLASLKTETLTVILGEGGSGGALALGLADSVLMMENAVYSVISPESCASILWSDPKLAEKAANALKLTAQQAMTLGVLDDIIPEPIAGAHRYPEESLKLAKDFIYKNLEKLQQMNDGERLALRFEKYRRMGNKYIADWPL